MYHHDQRLLHEYTDGNTILIEVVLLHVHEVSFDQDITFSDTFFTNYKKISVNRKIPITYLKVGFLKFYTIFS